MRLVKALLTGTALFLLAGCFQATTLVTVNPDGSGTVEERVMLGRKLLEQINGMMQGFTPQGGKKPKPLELFDPEKLRAQARTMGEGVVYRSGKAVATDEFEGFTATFAFSDINKLKLSQKNTELPGSPVPGENEQTQPVTFHFTRGPKSTLNIVQRREKTPPVPAPHDAEAAPSPLSDASGQISDEDAAKLTEMFKGMRISMALEVNGTILETNATYRDGRRLTILDFDMAKFVGSVRQLDTLRQLNPNSLEDARRLLKEIPGVEVDMNENLTVVFAK